MASTWLTPVFVHRERRRLITILVPTSDLDLVALLGDGYFDIDLLPRRSRSDAVVAMHKLLLGADRAIYAELGTLPEAAAVDATRASASRRVYCWGAMRLPEGTQLALTVGVEPCGEGDSTVPGAARDQALMLLTEHRVREAAKTAQATAAEIKDQEFLERLPPEQRERVRASFEHAAALRERQEGEALRAPESLLEHLPLGLAVPVKSSDPDAVERAVVLAMRATPSMDCPPPRDGNYDCLLTGTPDGKRRMALVTWTPHRGLPPYAEIRAAAERRLPKAFPSPRIARVQRPDLGDLGGDPATDVDTSQIDASPFDPRDPSWLEAFEERPEFDFPHRADMAANVRAALQEHGFEAIAWYQPHHLFTEETWGIYVDAAKLDELTCSLSDDLRRARISGSRDALAARLAVGLVLEHEHFHAKVEAALTWMELHAGHPKYVRYQRDVYAVARGTHGWLEEALANFWAWSWFSTESMLAVLGGALTPDQRDSMSHVVEGVLDLAPPGYRDWRDGRIRETWRTLATQAAQGRPNLPQPGIGMPLEPMLRDPLPFDYRATDVPLRFVGFGQVAHRLFSSPATLNRPSRRELRSAITRHFRYEHVPGGKGSHEKFKGADGRMFPLPQRDPVSQEVFGAFLDHFRLSKADYIQSVRPNL